MSTGSTRIFVRVGSMKKALIEKSERTGVDISSVVRKRLEEWLNEPEEESPAKP